MNTQALATDIDDVPPPPPAHRRGTDHKDAVLDDRKVQSIRAHHAKGWSLRQIAKKFGVCHSTVYQIVTGKTWAHVPVSTPSTSK